MFWCSRSLHEIFQWRSGPQNPDQHFGALDPQPHTCCLILKVSTLVCSSSLTWQPALAEKVRISLWGSIFWGFWIWWWCCVFFFYLAGGFKQTDLFTFASGMMLTNFNQRMFCGWGGSTNQKPAKKCVINPWLKLVGANQCWEMVNK